MQSINSALNKDTGKVRPNRGERTTLLFLMLDVLTAAFYNNSRFDRD